MSLLNKILFTPQTLTDDQKRIARENIGAAAAGTELYFDENTIGGDGSQAHPYNVKQMEAATAQANGKGGIVPAPVGGDDNFDKRVLCSNGEWNPLTPVTNAEIDEMFIENVVKIGGRNYPYVKIGNQLWLAENLDYAWEGLPINSNGSSSSPMAYYYNRGNKSIYGIDGTYKCGLLYNHPAVDYLQANRATLLPEGWHVPTLTEWQTLINFVGGLVEANTKLKALPLSVNDSYPPNTWNGTDNYQLNILPAGFMDNNLTAQSINKRTGFWTQDNSGSSSKKFVDFDTGTSSADIGSLNVLYDMSLRLVKDIT